MNKYRIIDGAGHRIDVDADYYALDGSWVHLNRRIIENGRERISSPDRVASFFRPTSILMLDPPEEKP